MPNLSKTALNDVKIGDTLKFTVKDYTDTVTYSGKVVAIVDSVLARSYEDVIARHHAMLSTDAGSGMDENIDNYLFFIVESNDEVRRPFAYHPSTGDSWFTNDEVEVIDPTGEYIITIYGCNRSQANIALRVLREHGYNCTISDK